MSQQKSDNYKKLRAALEATPPTPIYAKYDDGTSGATVVRTLCPHVLGYRKEKNNSDDSEESQFNERALCYQLDGPAPVQGWRCFNVSKLVLVTATLDQTTVAWETPSNYSQQKWQSSVKNVNDRFPVP